MLLEEEQTINLERISYPRVSEIIARQTEKEIRAIPIDNLVKASVRGSRVHSYCEAYLRGLWIPEIEDEFKPYVDAFIKWADENIEKTLYNNVRLYDDEGKFTGEFDAIVILKNSNKTALIDIKTSTKSSISWPVQLAAYNHLCEINGYQFDTIMNIHLKKAQNKVKVSEIEYKNIKKYWDVFSSSLICFNYFERGLENDDQ